MKDSSGQTVQVERIARYRLQRGTEYELIDFIPVSGFPGYTHRVALNNHLTSNYLGASFKPSAAVAVEMSDLLRSKAAGA